MENQKRTLEEQRTQEVWEAARKGDARKVRRLVEETASNLQRRDGMHNSALYYGVLSGNVEVVRYLVEQVGLDPLSANSRGETPFDAAYYEKKEEVLEYLEKRMGFRWEETYHNPIRRGFYPDPSIVRVGEDFYMVNSTFVFFPSIPVSHSKDLIHWQIIGYAITDPQYAGLDDLNGGMGYWAPDISYCEGRFYITATLRRNDDMEKRRVQMVTSSRKPEGPYEKPVFLDEDGIDPSIFHDEDGRKYMLLNRGARIRELSPDCKSFLGPASLLWYGDWKKTPEGPHLLKYGGYYYIFLAEGGTGRGHRVTVARSRELMGPYEPSPYNPILHQWDENDLIQCCGHGKPVQLSDGRWYLVYLSLRMLEGAYGIIGRETSLDPMTWTEDGWPLVNRGRGPSDQQRRPFGKSESRGEDREVLEISGQQRTQRVALGGYPRWKNRDWMTPRPLPKERICLKNRGNQEWLELKGQEGDLNAKEFRSILVTRQEEFDFGVWCEFAVPVLKEGESLGLTCYYDENSYIKWGVCRREGKSGFLLQEYAGDSYLSEKFMPCLEDELPAGQRVKVGVKAEGLVRIFACMLPKKTESPSPKAAGWSMKYCDRREDTSYLSSEGLKKGKRFTGATVGIYVQGEIEGEFLDWQQRL